MIGIIVIILLCVLTCFVLSILFCVVDDGDIHRELYPVTVITSSLALAFTFILFIWIKDKQTEYNTYRNIIDKGKEVVIFPIEKSEDTKGNTNYIILEKEDETL